MQDLCEEIQSPPEGSELTGVLVTGASSDIGQELCRRLSERQVKTLGTYKTHRPAGCEAVLPAKGIDLSVGADLDRMLALTKEHFSGPFGIVHCVGDFWEHVPINRCSLELAGRMITSHYLTLYGVLNRLLPLMAEVGGGRVLAISCTSTQFSYPDMAAFTSAKAAVETLVKCVANEWAECGIVANAVALSTIGTDKVVSSPSKPMSPQENYVTPAEAAQLIEQILYLSSPYFSGNVVRPLKYSRTFYYRGYFQRNPRGSASNEDAPGSVAPGTRQAESVKEPGRNKPQAGHP